MNIAVTGTIGAGKSFVAVNLAKTLECIHCDSDEVCRRLLLKGEAGWQEVKKKWGKRYLHKDESINREALRKAIFNNSNLREDLENILHPLVRQHVDSLREVAERTGEDLVVEIPLLFESGWQDDFDCVINVFVEPEVCLARVTERDSTSIEEVRKIINVQMDGREKSRLADYVIDNSGEKSKTFDQINDIVLILKKMES